MTLLTILMVSTTSLFIVNMRTSARTSTRQELKEEGLFLMNQIDYMLKNSLQVAGGQCLNTGNALTSFRFSTINNEEYQFAHVASPVVGIQMLTLEDIVPAVVSGPQRISASTIDVQQITSTTPLFNCFVNATNERFVDVNFRLVRANSQGDISSVPVVEDFSRLVQLRN